MPRDPAPGVVREQGVGVGVRRVGDVDFSPLIRNPSPSGSARVESAAASDPAAGSVKAKAATVSPLELGATRRLSTPGFRRDESGSPPVPERRTRSRPRGHPGQPLTNRAQVGGGDGLLGEEPVEEPLIGQGLDQASVDSGAPVSAISIKAPSRSHSSTSGRVLYHSRREIETIRGVRRHRTNTLRRSRVSIASRGESADGQHARRYAFTGMGARRLRTRRLPDLFRRPPRC